MEAAVNQMTTGVTIVNGSLPPTASECPIVKPVTQPISLNGRLLELETALITWALSATNGNKSRAAELLQIKRSTLGDRIKHCGLDRVCGASACHMPEETASL